MSTKTWYGGTRAVLYWKKRAEETCGLLMLDFAEEVAVVVAGLRFTNQIIVLLLRRLLGFGGLLILLEAGITLTNDSFDLGKFPSLFLNPHTGECEWRANRLALRLRGLSGGRDFADAV